MAMLVHIKSPLCFLDSHTYTSYFMQGPSALYSRTLALPAAPGLLAAGKKQPKAHQEKDRQTDHTQRVPPCGLGEESHQQRPNHRGELAKDIEKPKVFVRPLRRYQLAKIRPGNGLYAPLYRTHQKSHAPEKHQRKGKGPCITGVLFNVKAHKK